MSTPQRLASFNSAGGWESIGRTGAEYLRGMPRRAYLQHHRTARRGNLESLACSMRGVSYQWFLREVHDLRFPHIGDDRHALNGHRTFEREKHFRPGTLARRHPEIDLRAR